MGWAGILIVLISCLVAVIQEVPVKANQEDEIRLGVTIRNRDMLDRAPSCMHTFSRVELVNQHNSEVIIKSIGISPETTLRVDSDGMEQDDLVFDSLSQQVHASKVTDNFLALDPGQGAIVPLTFLPRFPPPELEEETHLPLPADLSPWQQADRELWMDSVGVRSNLGLEVEEPEIYRVSTMLLVETNYGVARVPFDANSVRDNPYSLPDVIYFTTEKSYVPAEPPEPAFNVADNGIRIIDTFWNLFSPEPPEPEPDCYDLYMRHPLESLSSIDIQVQEIMVSRPQNISLRIIPEKEPDAYLRASGPQHTIREWTEGGTLSIPPDGKQHYLATICTEPGGVESDADAVEDFREKADWIDPLDAVGSLGFVQIRTDSETLFISLLETSWGHNESRTVSYFSDESPDHDELSQSPNITSPAPKKSPLSVEHFETLEIFLVNGTADTAGVPLTLNNTSERDVNVMKVSIAFRDADAKKLEDLGIRSFVQPQWLDKVNWTIRSGEEAKNAFNLSVTWDLSDVGPNNTHTFDGKVLLQGSTHHRSSGSWVRAAQLNPGLDADVVLEIPFTINCVSGRLGFSVQDSSLRYYHDFIHNSDTPVADGLEETSAAFFPDSREDLNVFLERSEWDAVEEVVYSIHVFNSVKTDFTVEILAILDETRNHVNRSGTSPCRRFKHAIGDVSDLPDSPPVPLAGWIYLYYFLPEPNDVSDEDSILPTKCYLRFNTNPESGNHELPLYIFKSRVDVSVEGSKLGGKASSSSGHLEAQSRVRSVIGFPQMLDWFQNSKAGLSLRSLLGSKKADGDEVLLSRYMYGLADEPIEPDRTELNPVLLKVGATNPDEKEVFPFFVTNHNPVPLPVKIDVGEVAGLTIELARDPADEYGSQFISHTPQINDAELHPRSITSGPFSSHPVEGLRQFLLSDEKAKSLLSFRFLDAMEASEPAAANQPLLKELFSSRRYVEYHKHDVESGKREDCGESDGPQPFNKFLSNLRGRKHPRAVMISPGSKSVRSLACTDSRGGNEMILAPGGVARFAITLQSPPLSLLDQDISRFLTTGLVIKSGNVLMPIFVAFETPRGKLDVSPDPDFEGLDGVSGRGVRAVKIPAGLFNKHSSLAKTVVKIPPKSRPFDELAVSNIIPLNASRSEVGVPLYMTSSFNRPVELLQVSSCNPLFEVVNPPESVTNDPVLGVNIGSVKSVVPCTAPSAGGESLLSYQSFFSCALTWVFGRKELQPQGCGSRWSVEKSVNGTDTRDASRLDYNMANRAFNRALFITAWSMGDGRYSGHGRSPNGIVAPAVVDAVAKAWDVWRLGYESNLLRLSTSLRAVIRYNSSAAERSGHHDADVHLLSLAMGNLTVDSVLEMPTLAANHDVGQEGSASREKMISVDFPSTYVGAVSSEMIQVSNPTAATVRVRLAVAPEDEHFENYVGRDVLKIPTPLRRAFLTDHEVPYTQSGAKAQSSVEYVSQQWWDGGGSFFLADVWGGLVRSHYNITVRAASGALVSLLSPGLLSNVAFIAGCGARCAVKDEAVKFDGPHDVRSTSFIGASAGERAVLIGHQQSSTNQNGVSSARDMYFRAAGSMLTAGKGPAAFSVPFFALRQEVDIPPYGKAELGPILFRPPGRTKHMGCESGHTSSLPPHCGDRNFTSTLFLENSLTGLERVLLRGKAVWERVEFQDCPSQDEVDTFSDIEVRNGRESLIFPGTSPFRQYGSPVVVKHVMAKNVGDIAVSIAPPSFVGMADLNQNKHKQGAPGPRSCSMGEFTLSPCNRTMRPIRLRPGENYTFSIQHEPRCTQLSSFVALTLEYMREEDDFDSFSTHYRPHSRKGTFRKLREELFVGYKMDQTELARCVPAGGHVVFGFLDAMEKLGLKRPEHNLFEGYGMFAILSFALSYTCIILTVIASGLILARKLVWRFATSSAFTRCLLRGRQMGTPPQQRDSNWLDTLRCLSRLDPTAADLQTLGREQTRLVLLNQFRANGVMPPLCLNASGVFQRERNSTNRLSGNKSGISGSGADRIRTISDAIFKNGRECTPSSGIVSYGVGWKTAFSRGIINDFTLQKFNVELATERLLHHRIEHPSLASEEDSEEIESASSSANEADLSDTHYIDEEIENQPQTVGSVEASSGGEDSDTDSDEFSEETFGGKVEDKSTLGDGNAALSIQELSASFHSETAEYTQVKHKGKSSKRNPKPRAIATAEGGHKNHRPSLTSPVKPKQASSTKILVQKNAKHKAGKNSNGRLSAKAAPFEPKPSDPVATTPAPKKSLTAKSKEFTPSRQPSITIRPPPGLAPPPGFEGSSPTRTVTPSRPVEDKPVVNQFYSPPRQPSTPAEPPELPIPPSDPAPSTQQQEPPLSLMGSPRSIGGEAISLTPQNDQLGSLLAVQQPASPPPASLHTTGDGFDIMDFLDGVLAENAGAPPPAPPPGPPPPPLPAAAADAVTGPSLLSVPLNPWAAAASNESRPRASAYGINLDEDTSERGTEAGLGVETSLGVDLPMLTPAAILGQQQPDDEKDFYSSLLK